MDIKQNLYHNVRLFINVLSLVLIASLYRMGKIRTQKKGKLTNYGVVAGRIEPVKNGDYSDVIMGVSGVFNLRTQLNDALIESCAVRSENGGPCGPPP